jgi:hypothetical protein
LNIKDVNILINNNSNSKYPKYTIKDIIVKIIKNIDIYKLLIYIFLNCNQTFKKYRNYNYMTVLKDMFNNPKNYNYNISNNKWNDFIQDINNNTGNITLMFKHFVSITYLYIIYNSDILKKTIVEYIDISYSTFLDNKNLYFYNLYLYNHQMWILNNTKIFFNNIINNNNNEPLIKNYNNWKVFYINNLQKKYNDFINEYNRIINFHKNYSNKDFEDSDYEHY